MVPDPNKHADQRNWIESILRWIPGFKGYLEKEYRRDSDQLARKWLAERLERAKPKLNDFMRELTEQGNLSALGDGDRLRARMDKVIGRFRSAPVGYSGLFDFVRVREDRLDQVYAHDAKMMEQVEGVASAIESLRASDHDPRATLQGLVDQIDQVDRSFDMRDDLLAGLEP